MSFTALRAWLSNNLGNTGTALTEEQEAMWREMAVVGYESHMRVDYVAAVAGQATYSYPTAAGRVLAITYNDNLLTHVDFAAFRHADAEHTRPNLGTPVLWVTEGESLRTFRVYPAPAVNSPTIGTNTPLNSNLHDTFVVVSITHTPSTWLPHEVLWAVLESLARDFNRDSSHHDELYAKACLELSAILRGLQSQTVTTPRL